MKTTIRIVAAAALLAVASAPAFAQGGGGGGRGDAAAMQAQRRAMLFEGITLSDAQKASIDSIYTESQKAMADARSAAGDDRAAMMNKMRELQTKQADDIKKVLTPDQVKKYEENLAKMPQGRGGRAGRGGGNS